MTNQFEQRKDEPRFPVMLTKEEVSFMVSGLKDLNAKYLSLKVDMDPKEWEQDNWDGLVQRNEHCIEQLETVYQNR